RGATPGALVVFRAQAGAADAPPADPLRPVASALPAGVVVLDGDGRCSYCNPVCATVAGFGPEDGLGDGWVRFVHPEDQEFAAEWQTAARQQKPYATEIRFRDTDGRVRWAQLRAAPLRAEDGRYLGLVGVLEDVALWKELEQELGLQQKLAEDLRRDHQQ